MALGKRRPEDESQLDLTPMLDVVFIMLIFFIVTASFVKESGIDVNKSPATIQPPRGDDNNVNNVVFVISDSGDIELAGRRIDLRSVRANVERIHAENPDTKVIIRASPQAKAELFVAISDQVREAGVYDISLTTK